MTRNVSVNGLDLITSFEGCRLKAYKPISTEKFWTIGYGHYGMDVIEGQIISQTEADKLLKKDCEKFEKHVNTYMKTYNFNQNQYDALVSFAFNVGNIHQLTNKGKRTIKEISEKITAYNKVGGKILNGLVRRREAEKTLFDTPHETSLKDLHIIVEEVINGKWGTGNERKKRLTNSGYDYNYIQSLVNKKLKGK